MADNIKKIKILQRSGNSIFAVNKYVIPLYQRAFAWEDKEIEQMIDDILNFRTDNYYLGTLIVDKRKDGKYEVIDGQQRLTALFLLFTALDVPFDDNALSFEYRLKSDETLARLRLDEQTNWRQTADEGILSGFDTVSKRVVGKIKDAVRLKGQLRKVSLVRVIVPPNTDLNKYFEIMNNRGEQLEQQDIVKSHLIARLSNNRKKQDAFARIWDACSDMAGYVQMHFDKPEREHYFGRYWVWFDDSAGYYVQAKKTDRTQVRSINEITDNADITSTINPTSESEDEDNIRFDSFITFRHFLLHVLRIFETKELGDYEYDTEWSGELIDDKKLIQHFEDAFPYEPESKAAVERFGLCMLQCRFLFDNYMLKREFNGDDTEGKWSLKVLDVTRQRKYGVLSAYYKEGKNKVKTRMLQSMLRVTFTSPLVMHWVTEFLAWLYFNEYEPWEAVAKLEYIARREVSKYMENGDFYAGLDTPNIVFNYLDYLLWDESRTTDFQFEFRNSVEHWYPQHPIDSNVKWERALHHFGNLCIVSSGINSKFSNNMPAAKKANFRSRIERQSLKLRLMADATANAEAWTEDAAVAHGEAMLNKIVQHRPSPD
jgi:hypothetical protein